MDVVQHEHEVVRQLLPESLAERAGDGVGTRAVGPGGAARRLRFRRQRNPLPHCLDDAARQRRQIGVLTRERVPRALHVGRPEGEQRRLAEARAGDDGREALAERLVEPVLEPRAPQQGARRGHTPGIDPSWIPRRSHECLHVPSQPRLSYINGTAVLTRQSLGRRRPAHCRPR